MSVITKCPCEPCIPLFFTEYDNSGSLTGRLRPYYMICCRQTFQLRWNTWKRHWRQFLRYGINETVVWPPQHETFLDSSLQNLWNTRYLPLPLFSQPLPLLLPSPPLPFLYFLDRFVCFVVSLPFRCLFPPVGYVPFDSYNGAVIGLPCACFSVTKGLLEAEIQVKTFLPPGLRESSRGVDTHVCRGATQQSQAVDGCGSCGNRTAKRRGAR